MSPRVCAILLAVFLSLVLGRPLARAREIHVAKTGRDTAAGEAARALLTVSKAAELAQPGDTVTVHAGTYREWVRPPRGGTGPDKRITYRAAPGEEVILKGSERVTNWIRQAKGGGVWRAEVPNALFGNYNPFALKLSGGWLHYGQWHHRGDVYLDGEALCEVKTAADVAKRKLTWHATVGGKATVLRANFGRADPNKSLTEINVRECVFFPDKSGLKYITVDGLGLMHSAENWQPPGLKVQKGTIGPRMGKHWIIQNCHVRHARCVGIVLGHAEGVDFDDIDAFGDHVIRNNLVQRCGEAGIAGQKGATRCLIEGNLVEDTNYRKEFGGWETAAIKFHQTVDTVLRGNLIRRVGHQSHGAFGIWMDWANQGARITGNIIYDTATEGIFLEMDHGPTLVDNNIVIGGGVRSNSEASVFAHNLFVNCPFRMVSDTGRKSEYYKPHTRERVSRLHGIPRDDRWYYNIFVGRGLDRVKRAGGYAADWNLYLGGATKSSFGDKQSEVDPTAMQIERKDTATGVTLRFTLPASAASLKGPWVDGKLIGVMPTVGQTVEDRHARPITVNTDLRGRKRPRAAAGPLAAPGAGEHAIVWEWKKTAGQ